MEKSSCFLCSASAEINSEQTNGEPKNFHIFQNQLFSLLLIPPEHKGALQKLCIPERLCLQCLTVAEEIIHLKKQISTLELKIQYKVETIGKSIVDKTSALECDTIGDLTESWSREMKEWWLKFQYPVIQNFAKGYIPNAQVRIKKYDCLKSLAKSKGVSQKVEPISEESIQDISQASQDAEEALNSYNDAVEMVEMEVTTRLPSVTITENIFEDYLPQSDSSPLGLRSSNSNVVDTTIGDEIILEDESIPCPVDDKCPYTIEFGPRSHRTRDYALKRLCLHYSNSHCEPKRWDIYTVNTEGRQCIPCKFCSFQALVKVDKALKNSVDGRIGEDMMNKLRRNAIYSLTRHELQVHYLKLIPKKAGRPPKDFYTNNRLTEKNTVPIPSPKWIQRVFCCPISNCNYSYEFKWYGGDDDKAPQGLQKLGDHCLQYHLIDQSMPQLQIPSIAELEYHYNRHLDVLDGIQHLRCPYPKCGSCIFILDKDARIESCRLFAEHYGSHMYKSNAKSLCQISQIQSL